MYSFSSSSDNHVHSLPSFGYSVPVAVFFSRSHCISTCISNLFQKFHGFCVVLPHYWFPFFFFFFFFCSMFVSVVFLSPEFLQATRNWVCVLARVKQTFICSFISCIFLPVDAFCLDRISNINLELTSFHLPYQTV